MGELPVLKKCCFCVPLRYGLLTWGYIKLAIAVIALIGYSVLLVSLGPYAVQNSFVSTNIGLLGALIVTETVIHILFIIGAHKKKIKYLKIYYIYAIVIWVTILVLSIIGTIVLVLVMWDSPTDRSLPAIAFTADAVCIVLALAAQTFLVLSIRSEIIKLRSSCPYRFVKDDNEPEGTINSVKTEEETNKNNDTVRIL